jgi:hypothetical protein
MTYSFNHAVEHVVELINEGFRINNILFFDFLLA